ncbi:MAG: hypothetical protein ACC609_03815 [Methanobacterium formicicum]
MNPIEQNAFYILKILVEKEIKIASGNIIKEETDFDVEAINDAVDYLEHLKAAKVTKRLRTSPYTFSNIQITSNGRYLYYEIFSDQHGSIIGEVAEDKVNIDIGIITALKVELESVLEHLHGFNKKTIGSRTYFIGKINSHPKSYNIIVSKSPNAGSNDSAALTSDLIHEFDPDYIVKIGIAGGYREEVKLGDIVISNQIYIYDYTKEYDDVSVIRPEPYRSNAILTNLTDSYLWEGKVDGEKSNVSKYVSAIATGNKVIRSEKAWKDIKKIHEKIIAIEMEGGGIATVAHNKNKGILIISGISDYGDCKKNDNWHERASKNAAQFFFDFIKNNEIT